MDGGQATAVTAAAQAAAEAAALAAEDGVSGGAGGAPTGGDGDTNIRAFELYKLSHNIKKMLGKQQAEGFGGEVYGFEIFGRVQVLSPLRLVV